MPEVACQTDDFPAKVADAACQTEQDLDKMVADPGEARRNYNKIDGNVWNNFQKLFGKAGLSKKGMSSLYWQCKAIVEVPSPYEKFAKALRDHGLWSLPDDDVEEKWNAVKTMW
jgi:hypothetical protein